MDVRLEGLFPAHHFIFGNADFLGEFLFRGGAAKLCGRFYDKFCEAGCDSAEKLAGMDDSAVKEICAGLWGSVRAAWWWLMVGSTT